MNFVSTAAICPTCAPFLTGSVHKGHAFIFTSLRRIYLGDAQDSRREEIDRPRLDIATQNTHRGAQSQQRILVRGLEGLLAAQSAIPRLTPVERAARLALDKVNTEACLALDIATEGARVWKGERGGSFCSGQAKEAPQPATEPGRAQGCV